MTTIAFHSAKGGSGCTTTATLYALHLSRTGRRVHLSTAGDSVQLCDVAAILALPAPDRLMSIDANFTAGLSTRDNVINMVDFGYRSDADLTNDINVLVVRNEYLSLRRALGLDHHALRGAVVLKSPTWSLCEQDVSDTLSLPVLEVLIADDRTQSCLDAGLLRYRPPSHHFLGLNNLIGVPA
jgi:hypothetical protein